MENLHDIQMKILRELLFYPNSRFTDLNIEGLDNDHFSYHVRVLVTNGFVVKDSKGYTLTKDGKEFANRMDTDLSVMEKQPKVSVLIISEKEISGIKKYMVQTRLKEPYYGYKGFMTGKIRYNETIYEAASRELMEETGLMAKFSYQFLLHEMVYDKRTNEILEDKFFNVVYGQINGGKLVKRSEAGMNEYVTEQEFFRMSPKYHNEDDIFRWYLSGNKEFIEEKYYIEKF